MRGQQQQGGANASMDFLWISAFIVLGLALLWYNQHEQLVAWVFQARAWELKVAAWMVHTVQPLLDHLHIHHQPWLERIEALQDVVNDGDPKAITFKALSEISGDVAIFFLPLSLLLACLMAWYLLFHHPSAKFKRTFSMKSLRNYTKTEWPQCLPVTRKNLVKVELDASPWAMSLSPMAFGKANDLLEKGFKDGQPSVTVRRDKAGAVFALQMGPVWSGLESLPPHAQALFAIFAAKANHDNDAVQALLYQISRSAYKRPMRPDFSGTRELLVKHVQDKAVGRAVSPHAYVLTVMASMLELARSDGVLASAEFLWLKPIDRRLWYMLNNVGRQTAFPEVAGPYAHWLVEKRLRRPLKVPMINEAVTAFEQAISEIKYVPED